MDATLLFDICVNVQLVFLERNSLGTSLKTTQLRKNESVRGQLQRSIWIMREVKMEAISC